MNKSGVRTLLKLKIPSASLKKEFAKRYLDKLVERVKIGVTKNGTLYELSPEAKGILLPNWETTPDKSILKKLLVSEPIALKGLNDQLTDKLNAITDETKRPSKETLLLIFGYERVFNTNSKSEAYWLSKQIDTNTCVYCNRQYAFTIEKGDGRKCRQNVFCICRSRKKH